RATSRAREGRPAGVWWGGQLHHRAPAADELRRGGRRRRHGVRASRRGPGLDGSGRAGPPGRGRLRRQVRRRGHGPPRDHDDRGVRRRGGTARQDHGECVPVNAGAPAPGPRRICRGYGDAARRRVRRSAAITGIGLLTPLGGDAGETFEALCGGRSGLCRPPAEHPMAGVLPVVGLAPPVAPTSVLPPTEARMVDRFVVLAIAAADAALADAGLRVGEDVDPTRVAVVLGNGFGGLTSFESQVLGYHSRGRTAVHPYLLGGMLPNMAAARLAIKYGIQGFTSTIATACASGAYAAAEALRLVRDGLADVVVCGGSEAPLLPTIATSFRNARALARDWDDPIDASRPFDRRRDGFVLAEGAGVLVVERLDHADARGAAGYADLVGWGTTTDAHHPTTPRADGAGAAASTC